jgi:hypothetical protein
MAPDQDSSAPQRRGQARRAVVKGALIAFNNRSSTMNCRVRNLSATGAKLEIPAGQLLPHTFDLHIGAEPVRRCELRWVKGHLAGVRFLAESE